MTAIVPARDEADVVTRSLGSLLAQDYPGALHIILVDDNSTDGTGDVARALDHGGRLEVISGAPLAGGWTGKLWAQNQGVARAGNVDYLLLTDADIAHAPDTLRSLVARAEAGGLVLTSLMAKLTVETWPEKLLIPAFIFFFDMLFPFAWVNDPRRRTAAAAGGVMLARREALETAGGLAAIRGAIIDDCALGAAMKRQGPIWLGLTERARSLRPYASFGEIARMVSRSAYAQLNYSPALLAGTILGMALVYLAGPILALFGHGLARWAGLGAWLAMAFAFQPMLRLYRRSPSGAWPCRSSARSTRALRLGRRFRAGGGVAGSGRGGFRPGFRGWAKRAALRPLRHGARAPRHLPRASRMGGKPFSSPVPLDGGGGREAVGGGAGRCAGRPVMTPSPDLSSGKDHTKENFPVASALIARAHRPVVLAFYKVARMADDIADHARLSPSEKLARLDAIEASLKGETRRSPRRCSCAGCSRSARSRSSTCSTCWRRFAGT